MRGREWLRRERTAWRDAITYHLADRPRRQRLARAGIVTLGLAIIVGTMAWGLTRYNEMAEGAVPAQQLIAELPRGGARVLDRNGELLYEFVDRTSGLRRPVALDEISEWMRQATIATEDRSFYDNRGVNVRGTLRAGVENFAPFLSGRGDFLAGSGGSSITQQLARNVYMTHEERADRSVRRKLREMVLALELTARYEKDEILEWYLNSISYGGIYVGVEAAARGYFDKHASELTLAEAAVLAGIPQSPARYDPLAPGNIDPDTSQLASDGATRARQGEVLQLMVRHGVITEEEADEALGEPVVLRPQRFEIEAAHFVLGRIADEIIERFGEPALYEWGLEVTTTLDLHLQRTAEEILEKHIVEYGEPAGSHNGAFVALDPHTSEILVYVGSRDYFREEIEGRNDNVLARNSPGSTLKPFTYMAAFMKGWGTGTGILDTPLVVADPATGRDFRPRNPGGGFQGPVTAAEALGNSLNIPAIKTMQYATVLETVKMYQDVGYTTLDSEHGYGPALTTGGGEVTLLDQVIAYSVLASGGVLRGQEVLTSPHVAPGDRTLEPAAILRVEDPDGDVLYEFTGPQEERIVDEAYTYLVTSILADPDNTCLTYACGALALPNGHPSAAKTGTSEPFEERGMIGETWTIGYTRHLVAGVWAGNADNSPLQGITSDTLALLAWQEFMVEATAYLELPATEFERPERVVSREVCWPSGRLPTSSCPSQHRYTSLFAAEALPESLEEAPELYDSWWRDGRLVFPADEVGDWTGLGEWAARHNLAVSGSAVVIGRDDDGASGSEPPQQDGGDDGGTSDDSGEAAEVETGASDDGDETGSPDANGADDGGADRSDDDSHESGPADSDDDGSEGGETGSPDDGDTGESDGGDDEGSDDTAAGGQGAGPR